MNNKREIDEVIFVSDSDDETTVRPQRRLRMNEPPTNVTGVIIIDDEDTMTPPILPCTYYRLLVTDNTEYICIDVDEDDRNEVERTLMFIVDSVVEADEREVRHIVEGTVQTLVSSVESVVRAEEEMMAEEVRSSVHETIQTIVNAVGIAPLASVLLADDDDDEI